ncbi:glycosyltransferase family 4 protein [Dyadobacter sp. UP-52]|uniref:Glycosyltransferase family 4 protein n=2 Tax=Dyadobacter subterraneus TaxID=2773304 RepID=A0ABR9WM16_9BACT|nr:glycosyltransferase family 4 protein [Dyadobacter subterraneus]
MKYPHTGLFHFCLQLGNAILREIDSEHETVKFYLPESQTGVFGSEAKYQPQHFLHKHLFPKLYEGAIWHCTFQASNYFPSNRKVRIIITIHDLNFLYDSKQTEKNRKRSLALLQKKINRADHIVAISHYVQNDLKTHLVLGEKPTSVIYNGCNVDDSLPIIQPENIPDQPFLFSIGTIVEKKNFHVLPALLKNNNFYLVLAGIEGDQDYVQQIKNEAIKYGVEDRLLFTGPISENDKKWYLSNCKAFLFPSTAEGFGLPVIEAMYFGKPVILSTCTSLPEIGGDFAYYFESFDPESMQNVLKTTLEHFEETMPSGKIRERALSFSWQKAARQYLSIYRDLA